MQKYITCAECKIFIRVRKTSAKRKLASSSVSIRPSFRVEQVDSRLTDFIRVKGKGELSHRVIKVCRCRSRFISVLNLDCMWR